MYKLTLFVIVLMHTTKFSAQPSLHWDKTFTGRTHMNQSSVAADKLGNTWCMMLASPPMTLPDIHFSLSPTSRNSALAAKMNSEGKIVGAVEFNTNDWRGLSAMECSPASELWVLCPYNEKIIVRVPGTELTVLDTSKTYGALLVTVISKEGKIRFSKNVPVECYDNMLDISFDSKGNAHIISQWIDRKFEPVEGAPSAWREYTHLIHSVLSTEGEVLQKDDFFMPSNYDFKLVDSHVHVTENDDFYIATKYEDNVLMNGVEIIPDKNPEKTEFVGNDNHAVIIHFDKAGKFDWYKVISGHGNQWLTDITSDKMNIYFSVFYYYTCDINRENKITYNYETPSIGNGLMYAAVSHAGELKWTKQMYVRNYTSATLNCFGVETDHKGQLMMFCNFSDSVAIHGKYKDYTLKYDRWMNGCNFFMLCDTLGDVLEVRNDIVQKAGSALYLDAAANGDDFSVTGFFLAGMINYHYDNELHRMISDEWDTKISVNIGDKTGEPFPHKGYGGGIFCYSFKQPKYTPPTEPIRQPEPVDSTFFVMEPEPTDTSFLADTPEPIGTNYVAHTPVPPIVSDSTFAMLQPPTIPNEPIASMQDTAQVIQVFEPTSFTDIELKLFPNPTRHWLNAEVEGLEEFCNLQVHNMKGQLVFSSNFFVSDAHLEWKYDVSEWAADTYVLTIITGGNKKVSKRWVKTD